MIALSACVPEDLADPKPDPTEPPVLPTLLCEPFIKTGYTEKLSYFPGEKMKVFFDSREGTELCRLNLYTVAGEPVFSTESSLPLVPEIPQDASEYGFDLPVAVEFIVPELKSGIYMIEKQIPFIVKTDEPVGVTVIYPSNTANAYAESGGKSLYSQQDRPAGVSFQRPIPLASLSEVCLKWFSTLEDLDIGYIADIDMEDYTSIEKSQVVVIAGHSEYWTRQGRLNFDRFVDSGGDALILSGNTMWWQVRYSEDLSRMMCYKDGQRDPVEDALLKTINWSEPVLQYPILSSIGAHFPLGGYGQKTDAGWNGYKVVNPESPLFEGLDLSKGDIISLPSLEYDGTPIAGYDDAGYPVLDADALDFEKLELLGFDKGFRVVETVATFIAFQKTPTSGIVINTSTTDWCSSNGMGGSSGNTIKKITYNALTRLVNDAPVFSE